MKRRFAFDLGTNSIGWAVYEVVSSDSSRVTLQPIRLLDLGVRIFSDGRDAQSKQSLAADRRDARSARRRRDRYIQRRKWLMRELVRTGLMPQDERERKELEKFDPYILRKRALDEELTLYEIGRIIFHLNQRRGFKSNRKTDAGDDEASNMKQAIQELERVLQESGARTIGEWLADRHEEGKAVRFRGRTGKGNKQEWDGYPNRTMLRKEFDLVWSTQQKYHSSVLTDDAESLFREIIFTQRPLRPIEPGYCTFHPEDHRAPRALPSAQRFRILQDLNHLRLTETDRTRSLTLEERDVLFQILLRRHTDIKIEDLARHLSLPEETTFNLGIRKNVLKVDETAKRLRAKKVLGSRWDQFSLEEMDEIVYLLVGDGTDENVRDALGRCGLSSEEADRAMHAVLPSGYVRFGPRALASLIREMEKEVIDYSEAARRAGYDHAQIGETADLLERLPRYQEVLGRDIPPGTEDPNDPYDKRYGRFPNPTVHIGLNQLRRVVNALVGEYGRPDEVVVELARELKQGFEARKETERGQKQNQKRNEEADAKARELGIEPSGDTRMRYRLWLELGKDPLDRRCPYTGTQIAINKLFSAEIEIDHILPFSRTLDNTVSNRTLCAREANRRKGDLTPAEAVEQGLFEERHIRDAMANMPGNRKWRFASDAMQRFEQDERFLDRHLHETQWLGRLAKKYMEAIAENVWVIPGRLTALLRAKWGLNSLLGGPKKNRNDHRHHAIDAAVVGVTDRGLLQRISTENARQGERGIERLHVPKPFDAFRDRVKEKVEGIIVSHKIDHGKGGALHEETAYGIVSDPESLNNEYTLVSRKPVTSLSYNEISGVRDRRVRDPELRESLLEETRSANNKKELQQVLSNWSERTGVRRLRILRKESEFIPVVNSSGKEYKAVIPGENHRVDVFQMPNGDWNFDTVSRFEANQSDWETESTDVPRLIIRLHKGDLVEIDCEDKGRKVMRIYQLHPSARRVQCAAHNEAGVLQTRHADSKDTFRWMLLPFSKFQEYNLRPVIVTETGRVVYKKLG